MLCGSVEGDAAEGRTVGPFVSLVVAALGQGAGDGVGQVSEVSAAFHGIVIALAHELAIAWELLLLLLLFAVGVNDRDPGGGGGGLLSAGLALSEGLGVLAPGGVLVLSKVPPDAPEDGPLWGVVEVDLRGVVESAMVLATNSFSVSLSRHS